MKQQPTILCINGSDSTGHSGIQADIRTTHDLGCRSVTSVTSITIQNTQGIRTVKRLSAPLIAGQIAAIYDDMRPAAVKIGMVDDAEAIQGIRDEIVGCQNIVSSMVIVSSHGGTLMDDSSIKAACKHLLPVSRLLLLKALDAEIILGHTISTDEDMLTAARKLNKMGAQWIFLRGASYSEGRVKALLYGDGQATYFSSYNTEAWRRHGISGVLSTAIACRLALGDEVPSAVRHAHEYIHTQVIYSNANSTRHSQFDDGMPGQQSASQRQLELYDTFLSLVADKYRNAHDVSFYATAMNITPRYLAQLTRLIAAKTPKQIVDDYILDESKRQLSNTSQSIQQVATTMGFTSQIIFARFFKSKTGLSPKQYRNG